jgi:hypothetical protein
MALLDFIKNRNAQTQQPAAENTQAQKPETAKQMYTRQAGEEKATQKPITPEIKAQADRATAATEKATQHQQAYSAPAPEGSTNTAHLQNQNRQDKTQASLSPTDDAKGKTAAQEKRPAPEKTPERPQTMARRPPSWER